MTAHGRRSFNLIEHSDVKRARQAAWLVALILATIAYFRVRAGHELLAGVLGGAAALIAAASVRRDTALWFFRGWMTLGEWLGYVNSRIILSVLYWLVMTPIGFGVRLSGYDPLDRRTPKRASYWIVRKQRRQERLGFERTF
jgi:hypothetical protein